MFDSDAFSESAERMAELDKLLTKLQDCDLGDWGYAFVDDMIDRLAKFGDRTTVTPLQWEQIERMRKQYGC